MMKKGITKVTLGGWYQRTTLHLSELHGFFKLKLTKLELSKAKINSLHKRLDIKSVTREQGHFEHIKLITNSGIEVRYYEDGLYILESNSKDIDKATKSLHEYFENGLKPAVNYLFSLGAPTPKILANMKETHPIVVSVVDRNHSKYTIPKRFGEPYSKISSKNMTVYKTPTHIFIVTPTPQRQNENLIEMQIFFKEFKDHLERYLDIHRKVWEEISDIKEREEIFGKDVSEHRAKLDSYQKTISLIKSRINQMGPYARTRSSLSKYLKVEDQLASLFQYKFEDLFSTLSYIKDLWGMTSEYVNAAIGVVKEIESKAAASSLRSIQVLASLGFVAGLISYLTKTDLPVLSPIGIGYFVGLIALTFIISKVVRTFYQNKKYSLKFTERAKGL